MPDSNSPSSFDAPMKTVFTAETRPRIASGRLALDEGLAHVDRDHVGGAGDEQAGHRQRQGRREAEDHGRGAEHGRGPQHPHARMAPQRPVGEQHRHGTAPKAGMLAQRPEPEGADMQHLPGVDRQQGGGAARAGP